MLWSNALRFFRFGILVDSCHLSASARQYPMTALFWISRDSHDTFEGSWLALESALGFILFAADWRMPPIASKSADDELTSLSGWKDTWWIIWSAPWIRIRRLAQSRQTCTVSFVCWATLLDWCPASIGELNFSQFLFGTFTLYALDYGSCFNNVSQLIIYGWKRRR